MALDATIHASEASIQGIRFTRVVQNDESWHASNFFFAACDERPNVSMLLFYGTELLGMVTSSNYGFLHDLCINSQYRCAMFHSSNLLVFDLSHFKNNEVLQV